MVQVVLTSTELLERGQLLAQLNQDIGEHAAHEASIKKGLKEKSEVLERERGRVAEIVRGKKEPRMIDCAVIAYFDENVVRVHRTDTMETIHERPIQPDERQEMLRLEPVTLAVAPAPKLEKH